MRNREQENQPEATGPRRRGLGGHLSLVVAAVVIVAGTAGGYVGLRSTTPSSPSAKGRPHGIDVARAESTSPSGLVSAGVGGGPAALACPMTADGADTSGGDGGLGSATHLFTRTTADGVTVRAYGLASTGPCSCGPIVGAPTPLLPTPPLSSGSSSGSASGSASGAASGSAGTSRSSSSGSAGAPASTSPVTSVFPGRSVSLEFSDDSAVGQGVLFDAAGEVAVTPDATTGANSEPVAAISGVFGVAEGAPVWWVAVAVGPEVAGAQMTFADGSTDEMAPVDGVAVLAHQIVPSVASSGDGPNEVRGTLELLDATGAVITTVTFPVPVLPPGPLPVINPGTTRVGWNAVPSPTTTIPGVVSPPAVAQAPPPFSSTVMIACPAMTVPPAAPGANASSRG